MSALFSKYSALKSLAQFALFCINIVTVKSLSPIYSFVNHGKNEAGILQDLLGLSGSLVVALFIGCLWV